MHGVRAQSIAAHRTTSRWVVFGVCICLALLTWAVFGQTLRHDFVNYDDPRYVYQNTRITNGLNIAGIAWAFTHLHAHPARVLTLHARTIDWPVFYSGTCRRPRADVQTDAGYTAVRSFTPRLL